MASSDAFTISLVVVLTLVIHSIETLQYGVSFAGIQTRRLATAGSLFGLILLVSRTANMVQSPLLGTLADAASEGKLSVGDFEWKLRLVLWAATCGTILGGLALPTFVRYLSKGIEVFVRHGSYSGIVGALIRRRGLSRDDVRRAVRGLTPPTRALLRETRFGMIPWWFYAVDILVTAIFAVGVLASLYAGVLTPERRITAVSMSGIINGIATALLFLVISPRVAGYVDEAMQDKEGLSRVRAMVGTLVIGKVCGTVMAQFLLWHGAVFIAWVAGRI